jgi:glycosyltransferase involved in cell wall biosynthesis
MKVLQINILFNQGSTGKIVADIHNTLINNNIESIVCYGTGQKNKNNGIYKVAYHYELSLYRIWAHIMGLQYASGYYSTHRIIEVIKKEKPDLVHLHCINGFFVHIYKLFNYLKNNGIKTVLTLHAEFMYTGSCGHAFECERWKTGCGNCPQLWEATYSYFFDRTSTAWRKMNKAFEGFENLVVTSVSPWLTSRAVQSPILKNKNITTIENGIDTSKNFHPKVYSHLKTHHKITSEKVLLHVTAKFTNNANDLKGGRYIYKLAEKLKDENVKILIIGSDDKTLTMADNMINVGKIYDQNLLAEYYSMADLTVITSKRETFSMPLAESLACGTPVVGFLAGGPETICLKEYSEFVKFGDVEALYKSVLRWIDFKDNVNTDIAKIAKEYYSKERMSNKYIDLYLSFIQNRNEC